MKRLKIDYSTFAMAFDLGDHDTTTYLDTETGDVMYIQGADARELTRRVLDAATLESIEAALQALRNLSDFDREQLLNTARVEWDDANRYRMIPSQDSDEGYRDMRDFVWSIEDDHLRELLDVAIQGSGAFRRFKDVLHRYPEARQNWFAFRDEREKQRILEWFASEDLEPEFE